MMKGTYQYSIEGIEVLGLMDCIGQWLTISMSKNKTHTHEMI